MIKKVEASFDNQKKQLNRQPEDNYKNDFTAPKVSGDFGVEVKAYDEAGNISVANPQNTLGMVVSVTKWSQPKTNWTKYDRLNIEDYNRIKRNLEYLHEKANELYQTFIMEDMGKDKENREGFPYADEINKLEANLEIINEHIFTKDYGYTQRFFDNGVLIQWTELNRIESAILKMKEILDLQKLSLRRLSFKLGRFREVRI